MNPNWLDKYPKLNEVFMSYGWAVAPFMTGGDLDIVQEASDYILANPPQTDDDRRAHEERIYQSLNEPVFHPGYRARATWYGNKHQELKLFNHLYESAIFSYYKREYIQSVLCLLCALEGVMLSYYGYKLNSSARKPKISALINCIKETKSNYPGLPLDIAHNMYRDSLVNLLENWIYKDTSKTDLSLSYLNRHYVLHGMEAGNFYGAHDLHRLIIAFDLLIEFFNFRQGLFLVFLPDFGADNFIDRRRAYYEALAFGRPTVAEAWHVERTLLRDHVSYVPPTHDPNMEDSLKASDIFFDKLMKMAVNKPGR